MKTFLPIAVLTVFTATLLAAISGLLFAKGNATALTTVVVAAACALLLVLMYDRLGEFTLGPKGASAKLIRLEEVVSDQGKRLQDQQSLVNSMVKYWMSASVFHHLCGIALLRSYIYHDGVLTAAKSTSSETADSSDRSTAPSWTSAMGWLAKI